jgi:FkbM family methyltransferase
MRTIGDSGQWFKDDGDNTHRLNYDLNENSIVFDLGGFEGWFTEQIDNEYHCRIFCFEPINEYFLKIKNKFNSNLNILTFPFAISNTIGIKKIYFNGNSSSEFIKTDDVFEMSCITLDYMMNKYHIKHIDLMKINIEGGEYDLLDDIIEKDLLKTCDNLQIQFHTIIDNYQNRYNKIKTELEKTHHLTYQYPFVWENWQINN